MLPVFHKDFASVTIFSQIIRINIQIHCTSSHMLEALLALHPKTIASFLGFNFITVFSYDFFKKIFFYLKDKLTERERQISAFSLYSNAHKNQEPQLQLHYPCGWLDPLGYQPLLLMCISRKWVQKWMSPDSNQHWDTKCRHLQWQLNPLCCNTYTGFSITCTIHSISG